MKKKIIVILIIVAICFTGCKLRLSDKGNSGNNSNYYNNENDDYGYKSNTSKTNNENNGGSGTSAIDNVKANSFIKTVDAFLNGAVMKVNEGRWEMFSTGILYVIPVGNNSESCIPLELNATSPFSDKWAYAFVVVSYDGMGYKYYFVGEDESGHGIRLISRNDLVDSGKAMIYSSSTNSNELNQMKKLYSIDIKEVFFEDVNEIIWNALMPSGMNKDQILIMSKKQGCVF